MTRLVLPDRRPHEAFSLVHWQHKYHVGVGRDDKGCIREVWISSGKSGTQALTLARDSAVVLSIALQCGATIEMMRHAITRNADGSAAGPIGALLDQLASDTASSPGVSDRATREPVPEPAI